MDVTLCVPCPGKSPWLGDCLAAIRRQTLQPIELFVLSATPTDDNMPGSPERYGARVIMYQSGGLPAARNVALAQANGELLATVAYEVVVSPEWLGLLASHFDDHRVGASLGRVCEGNTTRVADRWRAAHLTQDRGPDRLVNPSPLPATNGVFRTQLIRELGGYDESDSVSGADYLFADCDLYRRLQVAGYDSVYEPSAGAECLRSDGVASIITTYAAWLQASCGVLR